MKREIIFRGICIDTKEWVYGYYVKGSKRHCIQKSLAYYPTFDIIPETLGQYTGLTDENGKKIFEGDIMKNKQGSIGIVKYTKYAEFILDFVDDIFVSSFNPSILRRYEVIGNIYEDNLESEVIKSENSSI